jgi:hypothetical protein
LGAKNYKHESDKHAKGINTWTDRVSMICMQLSKSESILDVATGILSATVNLNHLGIKKISQIIHHLFK